MNELSCVAGALNPDIIMITESWCNSDVVDAFLSIDGYDLQPDLRADREDTAQGRGGETFSLCEIWNESFKNRHGFKLPAAVYVFS